MAVQESNIPYPQMLRFPYKFVIWMNIISQVKTTISELLYEVSKCVLCVISLHIFLENF